MKTTIKICSAILSLILLVSVLPSALAATVPDAPSLSIANQANGIYAEWNAVKGAAKYIVYYRPASEASWSSQEATSQSFLLTKAQSGTLYYVQVQSVAANGTNGGYSKVRSMTFIGQTAISAITYNGGNTMQWNAIEGANGYQLARKKTGDKAYAYFTTAEPSYTESNVTTGVTYTYQVRAMYATERNGTAYGAWSKSASVVTIGKPVVRLSNKSNGIRAEWNAVKGASQYTVYYKKATDSKWSSTQTTNTYYPLLNLTADVKYTVQVRPAGKVNGPYSAVQTLTYVPMAKPVVTLSNKSNGIRAEWKPVSGAVSYNVYVKLEGSSEWEKETTTNSYYPILLITQGKTYCVQVQPVFRSGNGAYSAVSRLQYNPTATGKPVLRLFNAEKGIVVSWVPIQNAVSYYLYYREADDSSWQSFYTSEAPVLLTGTTRGTTYKFQVLPVFKGGVKGEYSKVSTFTFGDIERPALTVERIDNSLIYRWTKVKNATKYRVYLREYGTPDESWGTCFTADTEQIVNEIDPDKTYECVVSPYYGETEGYSSNFITVYGNNYQD